MPKYRMSILGIDPDKTALAAGRNIDISPKHAIEVTRALRGMKLEQAMDYLDEVIALKKSVPFKRHNKKVAHRSDLVGWHSGRYPVKACREIKKVLENLENNAIFKGLDTEKIKLVHIISQRARKIKGYMPRAQGSSSPQYNTLTHIEVVGEEMD
jgi:large subunit ribosomal protein L22